MSRLFWIVMALIGGGLVLLLASGDDGTVFGLRNDAFGQSLYFGIWGLVIATGILFSGIRFGHVARSLAIWLLVILVLVAGYQYRYELQDIASRVTAGLIPGSPLSVTGADGRDTVLLEKLSNGHFGVRAEINGADVDMVIDTGATATVLTAADARRAGISVDQLRYSIPVMTANGAARAARVTADEVRVGSIARPNLQILVAEDGQLGQSLLGMNFIGSLSGFNVRGDRMTLID